MQRWRRLLLITAVVAALAVLFHLIHVHGLEPIRAQVEQLGVWAPLGIVVLRGISILLPALPSTAYSLLAGALLGEVSALADSRPLSGRSSRHLTRVL